MMKQLEVPEFATYEDEAAFWDSLDTGDFMQDDGAWFRFETPTKRAVRIAVLPDIAEALAHRARAQGVSVETLVNVLLAESMSQPAAAG
ncbi:MAG TPA: CopG family antitoxin [Anaerolineae bacterium]|nr:CopG family antitoxin [Anaerolineae bacterium]